MVQSGNFGIIVSGGPAPGINSVISAVTIEAANRGYKVFGFREGFQAAASGEQPVELEVAQVTGIRGTGGSILGTSRFNPFTSEQHRKNLITTIQSRGIDKLVVIGGDGSAFLSFQLSQLFSGIKVVHVPKTIDNDLILPNHGTSFGFETARFAGAKIIDILMADARTTSRWFLVTSMGRKAGFLALGLGVASGATVTLIPEEFPEQRPLDDIAKVILSSIRRRREMGRKYGVAIIAEGLIEAIDPSSVPEFAKLPRDGMGRIHYSEIDVGEVVARRVRELCAEAGIEGTLTTKNIGYELRCHDPISFDVEYTRFLGVGAVRLLEEGQNGVMVCCDNQRVVSQPLAALLDTEGRMRSRRVDIDSDLYKIARSFMIR